MEGEVMGRSDYKGSRPMWDVVTTEEKFRGEVEAGWISTTRRMDPWATPSSFISIPNKRVAPTTCCPLACIRTRLRP